MIHAEWMINMRSGPVIGTAEVARISDVWAAIARTVPNWTPTHTEVFQRLTAGAETALTRYGEFVHQVPGVSIVLTRIDSGG